MTPQKVQVFSVSAPAKGTPKAQRRYRVKWRVDGLDRTRSLKTRVEADRLRAQLLDAAVAGAAFDLRTGVPEAWVTHRVTWFEWSVQWLELKWPKWAGNSRRSAVETLTALTPHLARPGSPSAPTEVVGFLRAAGPVPTWLQRWSVPLDEVTPALIETALDAATTRLDGRPMSATVARRCKNMPGSVLRSAVRHELLDRNPMDRVEWRTPERDTTLDVSTVPSLWRSAGRSLRSPASEVQAPGTALSSPPLAWPGCGPPRSPASTSVTSAFRGPDGAWPRSGERPPRPAPATAQAETLGKTRG